MNLVFQDVKDEKSLNSSDIVMILSYPKWANTTRKANIFNFNIGLS